MPGDQEIKDRVLDDARPIIEMGIADSDFPEVKPRMVVEWCCRLTLSSITTPGTVKIGDAATLRQYVEDLLDIGSVIR
jgi:hypothetical protein